MIYFILKLSENKIKKKNKTNNYKPKLKTKTMINYYNVFYFLTVSDGVKEVFDTFSNFFTFFTVVSLIAFAIAVGATIEYGSNK